MTESYIGYTKDGNAQSFVGEDAVDLFRAASLASMCGMMAVGLTFRGVTKTRALELASQYTGTKYKRGEHLKAKEELYALVRQRKGEIPAIVND